MTSISVILPFTILKGSALDNRPEHPVRHGAQVGSVLFKSLGQIIAVVHRLHILASFRHGSDAATPATQLLR